MSNINESGEMYLETILLLLQEKPAVRAVDVAEHRGYSKPSVSRALGLLKEQELIQIDGEGHIHLTAHGTAAAEKIYERHRVLSRALELLGISPETAAEDACRIEHVISEESFQAVKNHLKSTGFQG